MPMDRSKYPPNWREISDAMREAADWQCAPPPLGCGKPCRRPGQPLVIGDPDLGHAATLTVAHLNDDPADCRPENLAPLCAPCHCRRDAGLHAANARATRERRRQEAGQRVLFDVTKAVAR